VSAHFNPWVALAVPGALDLYVLRALQQRRDVFVAVLAMVAANVTAHLLTAGVLHEHWAITSAAGALAPLILWRVYSLKHTRTRAELLIEMEADAVSAPAPGDECTALDSVLAWVPGYHLDGCDGVHALEGWPQCLERRGALHSDAPDHVPASWMENEYPETHPSATHSLHSYSASETRAPHSLHSPVPYLAPVPDLPPEYAPGAVHSESPLETSDWEYLPGAQEYADKYDKPSVRGLRRELRIGQDRAERLLIHLGVIL
jgi:hypothetical protein